MSWLEHIVGLDDASGHWYLFWSGLGSDITEFAMVGALLGVLRKYNCHVHGCWRIGRHPVAGTPHIVCHRHNPDGPVTVEDLS